jgi:hypothetical protein
MAGNLERLLKKTSCGFHNASPKSLALLLGVLGLEVFEVSPAKLASERVDMKVDVPVPFGVKSAKQICPNSASFEATEPLKFPDIRQQILEVYG